MKATIGSRGFGWALAFSVGAAPALFVFTAMSVFSFDAADGKTLFEFDCHIFLKNYSNSATKLFDGAVPELFSTPPDFKTIDKGDPTLVAPFNIDNIKDSEGEMQCQKSGALNTLRVSYDFGAGDFSVTRATLVMTTILAAVSGGDKRFAENQFERLSAQAFKSLKRKQIRGDDPPLFGSADIDFTKHYAGRLVVTPEKVTFSIGAY